MLLDLLLLLLLLLLILLLLLLLLLLYFGVKYFSSDFYLKISKEL